MKIKFSPKTNGAGAYTPLYILGLLYIWPKNTIYDIFILHLYQILTHIKKVIWLMATNFMNKQSKDVKSRTRIPSSFWVVVGIILVSTLPYLSEILTVRTEEGADWVYLFGLNQFLPDVETSVLGFSGYRTFLYILFIFLFTTFGWMVWYIVAKNKLYRKALLVPVVLGVYQIIMILGGWRFTFANTWEVKTGLILLLVAILAVIQQREGRFNVSHGLKWLFIVCTTTFPFFHDIITVRGKGVKPWVPNIGIENILKDPDGYVLGFGSYRAFIYFFMLHLYAHLGWLGSFIYYNHGRKKIRPFLLVPVIVSFFSLMLFILNIQDTPFGAPPDIKFYITIGLSVLLAWNFFFNDKTERVKQPESNDKTV